MQRLALHAGDATDFPNDTPVTVSGLLDALVYNTSRNRKLALIAAYDGSNTEPALQTYEDAGVDGVTTANLAAVNSAVALLPGEDTDTAAEVQAAVASAASRAHTFASAGTPSTALSTQPHTAMGAQPQRANAWRLPGDRIVW